MAAFSSTKNQLARMLKAPALTEYMASIAQRGFVTKSRPLQNAHLVSTEQFGREDIEDIISMSQYVSTSPASSHSCRRLVPTAASAPVPPVPPFQAGRGRRHAN